MNFIAEDFHIHYISEYSLYVSSAYHRDTLVVIDADRNILAYIEYDAENPPAEVLKILSFPFGKAIAVLPQQQVIWLPEDIYTEDDKSLYSVYFDMANLETIRVKHLLSLGVVALYTFDPLLTNRWERLFEGIQFVPAFELVLLQSNVQRTFGDIQLGVHIYGEYADIFVYERGELKLYTSFEILTPDDLSYYILQVFNNFGLEEKVDKIWISGDRLDSAYGIRLARYATEVVSLSPQLTWRAPNPEIQNELVKHNVLIDSELCV